MEDFHARAFKEVLLSELREVRAARHRRVGAAKVDETAALDPERPAAEHLIGLALSAGGPRSATFGLGVLQALARSGFLRRIDYVSGTGGGSHIAGWLSAWIARAGFEPVDAALRGSRVGASDEPRPINQLRRRTSALLSGWSSNFQTRLIGLRNSLLNLVLLAAICGVVMLTATGLPALTRFSNYGPVDAPASFAFLALLLAASIFRVSSPHGVDLVPGPWTRAALVAVNCFVIYAVLVFTSNSTLNSNPNFFYIVRPGETLLDLLAVVVLLGFFLSFPFLIAFFRAPWPPLAFLKHTGSSFLAACVVASGLVFSPLETMRFEARAATAATVLASVTLAGLLYAFCMRAHMRASTRAWSKLVGTTLAVAAVCFYMTSQAWSSDAIELAFPLSVLTLTVSVIVVGVLLLNPPVVASNPVFSLASLAVPYFFLFGTFMLTSVPLRATVEPSGDSRSVLTGAGILLTLVVLLSWRIGENEFSLSGLRRHLLVSTYLGPSRQEGDVVADDAPVDPPLMALTTAQDYHGPYPLIGAAAKLRDDDPSGVHEQQVVPFLLSPLFSGYQSGDEKAVPGFCSTNVFAGRVSLGTAMAISDEESPASRSASPAMAFLLSMFSLRRGWWIGNPACHDTARSRAPRLGPVYGWLATFRGVSTRSRYLHLKDASTLDPLGIVELVKRRCALVLACDAVDDPALSFEHFGETVKRCRTDLGVEIDLELAPFRLGKDSARAHYQVGVIRYPGGDSGLLIYMRPSLTGDESADLQQHAVSRPEFPHTSMPRNVFDDTDFESYKWLGQHVAETMLKNIVTDGYEELSPSEMIASIRRRLQPGYREGAPRPDAARRQQPPPQALVDAVRSGDAVLWAGPGLAAQSGLPDWNGFLRDLLVLGESGGHIDEASAQGLLDTLRIGDLDTCADELSHRLPREAIVERMQALLKDVQPSHAHRLVAELPFMGAINTNFDALGERVFAAREPQVLSENDAEAFTRILRAKTFFLFNVLGDPRRSASLVLTLKEFRLLLNANPALKQFLVTLFLRYQVVFVGTSVKGIRDYLDALELTQVPERAHFAIVADTGLNAVELRYLQRTWNIQVIPYRPVESYPELPVFLGALREAVRAGVPAGDPGGVAAALDRVMLTNIGPFESLSIDLAPSWNLLLGDNGTGKTVILRAIAAALCGEAAPADAVTRLLRAGAQTGSVRLIVGNREYKVELKREADGSVKIVAASLSPLQVDNWLALGFPALRSVPLERPTGPVEPTSAAASPRDLFPLLTATPDGRMANLKQWLVNLDYASKGSGERAQRARRLLKEFFEVMRKLTPDLRLEPAGIDPETMEILVETDAGIVPLETISQGTGSVMSWIGTLLQRRSEVSAVSPGSEPPRALVLIDEIDAHMHPKWQRLFVEAFRGQFAVQILATTHSPLLVGSLTRDEIWLAHRVPLVAEADGIVRLGPVDGHSREVAVEVPEDDESTDRGSKWFRYQVPHFAGLKVRDGEVVEKGEHLTDANVRLVLERPDTDLQGWRADQILTSPLFRLDTARDPKTEQLLKEYTRLAALAEPSADEQKQLEEHAQALNIRLPSPQEQAIAREAYQVIHETAVERLKALSGDERERVLDEVKVQVTESVTGSRRPA